MKLSGQFSSLNDKTKYLFTLWELGSIRKSNHPFCTWFVVLEWILIVKIDFNCLGSFTLSSVDKVTTGAWSFVSVILNSGSWTTAVPVTKIHLSDHFNWKLI